MGDPAAVHTLSEHRLAQVVQTSMNRPIDTGSEYANWRDQLGLRNSATKGQATARIKRPDRVVTYVLRSLAVRTQAEVMIVVLDPSLLNTSTDLLVKAHITR